MNVTEVIAAARDWVGQHAATDPGFVGAHLLGSINSMQPGDAFPEYLDVDIAVLLSGQTPAEGLSLPYRGLLRENREILHKGLIIEAVYLESEIYENPENVLSNPTLAYDMRSGNILADPSGGLTLTQQKVVDGFSRRIWVKARCEEEKLLATGSLRGGAAAESIGEKVFYLSWGATCLSSLLALATLQPATHRRSLIRVKGILGAHRRSDLYKRMLSVLGYDRLDKPAVVAYLAHYARAFDRAVEVSRGLTPFSFKLSPHVRPYLIEGAREMIDEGHHQEALFWILIGLFVSNLAIQVDGDPGEVSGYHEVWNAFLGDLGFVDQTAAEARINEAMALASEFFSVADGLVENHPGISD